MNWRLVALGIFLSGVVLAAPTQITDTLYEADGLTLYNGQLRVNWGTYQSVADGLQHPAGYLMVPIANGVLSTKLEPNDATIPSGTFYTVNYQLSTGTPITECWVVPTSVGIVNLAMIRSTTCGTTFPTNTLIAASQITPGPNNTFLNTNNSGIVGWSSLPPSTIPGGTQLQYLRLQPNTGNNTTLQFANLLTVSAADYNFPFQTPGGTLTGGSGATVTLTPCPLGVNGTDVAHQLYVSAGTGTAEAVLLTGGTCTSGLATGTVIFTPANSHSGAWTIQSATNGGQEAYQTLATAGKGGTVTYGLGTFANCGTFTVSSDGITIAGSGSTATGVILAGGSGAAGTQIAPCFASQVLFKNNGGHVYGSTVSQLSMHDIGFLNSGLTGITAISLLNDTSGVFTNLSFYGTTNAMYGIFADRVWGTQISTVTSTGTVGHFFGSTVDNGGSIWGFSTVYINGFSYLGTAASKAVLQFQRCISCILLNAEIADVNLTGVGTGIQLNNDSEGDVLNNVTIEGLQTGISMFSNTVSSTTSAPGWTTLSNVQIDCAGGSCGTGMTGINIGTGVYDTQIVNPIITALSTSDNGIAIQTNASAPNSQPLVNIVGGDFWVSQGVAIVIATPNIGISIHDSNFFATSGGSSIAIDIIGASTMTGMSISGNYISGTAADIVATGVTFTNSLIDRNLCTNDPNGFCLGALTPLRASVDVNYVASGGETGANNAWIITLKDHGGNQMALTAGMRVCIQGSHSLQVGANTLSINNGTTVKNIRSHLNSANNISTAYSASALFCGLYDGTEWVDSSQ